MKIREILEEGLSDILFRVVEPKELDFIIDNNQLKLYSALAKAVEMKYGGGKYYYLSTTRSRLGRYHYSQTSAKGGRMAFQVIMLVLDGRQLRNTVGGRAVDYWGRDMRKIDPTKNEMEDRIISDKPVIDNASKYIKRIDIYLNIDHILELSRSWDKVTAHTEVIRKAMSSGLPVRVFDNEDAFIAGRGGMSGEEALEKLQVSGPEMEKRWNDDPYRYMSDATKGLLGYIRGESNDNVETFVSDVKRGAWMNDYVGSIQNDLHNLNREQVPIEITELARKLRVKNIRDMLKAIGEELRNK